MQQVNRRRPQTRCKCGHAKSKHTCIVALDVGFTGQTACGYCYSDCVEFKMDNLATLERLYQYNEEKKLSL